MMYRTLCIAAIACAGSALGPPAPASATELTRPEAISLALAANPEMEVARQIWEASRARANLVSAWPDPEFELEYEEAPSLGKLGEYGERAIGATQTIPSPLAWRLNRRAAAGQAEATRLLVMESRVLDLRLQVSEAYDRVLLFRRQLELAEVDLALAQDIERRTRVRVAAGDVTDLEVLRAQVETGRARNRIAEARSELTAARAALNTLLARDPGSPLILSGELTWDAPEFPSRTRLRGLAMEHRPELLGIQRSVGSARAARGAARGGLLPDISVGIHRQNLRQPAGEEEAWRFALSLEVPLWLAGRQRAELAAARADLAQAVAEEAAVRGQILLEVDEAMTHLETAAERVRLFDEEVYGEAERAFDIASRSYAEGKVGYLDLIEARRARAEVSMEQASAQFEARLAWSRLERAAGAQLSQEDDQAAQDSAATRGERP